MAEPAHVARLRAALAAAQPTLTVKADVHVDRPPGTLGEAQGVGGGDGGERSDGAPPDASGWSHTVEGIHAAFARIIAEDGG